MGERPAGMLAWWRVVRSSEQGNDHQSWAAGSYARLRLRPARRTSDDSILDDPIQQESGPPTLARQRLVIAAFALALVGCTALAQGAARNPSPDFTVTDKQIVPPTTARGRIYRVEVWLDGARQLIDYEEDSRLCYYAARVGEVLPVGETGDCR